MPGFSESVNVTFDALVVLFSKRIIFLVSYATPDLAIQTCFLKKSRNWQDSLILLETNFRFYYVYKKNYTF